MLVESMTVEGLYVISLALSRAEKLKAAGSPFDGGSDTGVWLTGLAVFALIISDILLFWLFNKYKRSEQQLNQKISDLTIANIQIRQEKDESTEANEKLKQEIAKLSTTNEQSQQESAQLTPSA